MSVFAHTELKNRHASGQAGKHYETRVNLMPFLNFALEDNDLTLRNAVVFVSVFRNPEC